MLSEGGIPKIRKTATASLWKPGLNVSVEIQCSGGGDGVGRGGGASSSLKDSDSQVRNKEDRETRRRIPGAGSHPATGVH